MRLDPGLHFDEGLTSSHFTADRAQRVEIDDPLIILLL
jgi:hypothetical protein